MFSKMPHFMRKWFKQVGVIRLLVEYFRQQQQRHHRHKQAARGLPAMVAIEISNICNLRCAKCPLSRSERPRGLMGDALYTKILNDIRSAGVPTEIALSGAGEPTLHPRLVGFVEAARSIPNVGVIGFATNGIALTPDLSERLLDAGLTRLKASLDVDDAATYQRINGADAYETVTSNFLRFCEINKQTGNRCKVTLKVTLYENDQSLGRRLTAKWSPLVDKVRVTRTHNWGGTKGLAHGNAKRRPCALPWQQVQILWDGQITLCCMDSMDGRFNLGNTSTVNLSQYWSENTVLKQARRQHEAGDLSLFPVCAACDICSYGDISL